MQKPDNRPGENKVKFPVVGVLIGSAIVAVVAGIGIMTQALIGDLDANSKKMRELKIKSMLLASGGTDLMLLNTDAGFTPSHAQEIGLIGKKLMLAGRPQEGLPYLLKAFQEADAAWKKSPSQVTKESIGFRALELADCYNKLNKSEKALETMKYAEVISDSKYFYSVRARIYRSLGKIKLAESDEKAFIEHRVSRRGNEARKMMSDGLKSILAD